MAQAATELLAYGADPNALDDDDKTALMLAATNGRRESAMLLLPVSDLNARDNEGQIAAALARENWPDLAAELDSFGRAQSERGLLEESLQPMCTGKGGGKTL
ncbi:ankyrin repeat domain-containing protein [Massilia sp. TWP1-3-3]|uniref:ankyrin repeat domain-containing protein n=1 Tax=Massilia sp. TWP1-3-3 TaxID=2804573 RepID=UPI003CE7594A